LKWTIGGQTGEDEPELAGAFFLGPPLPLMGQLFVMAEIKGEIRLVVVDAETGRYQWSQQLAVVGQRNILADQSRRLAGASPSFADGVLVCPTSAGAVVAVDISNRTLLWGFTYDSQRVALQSQWNRQTRSSVQVAEEFWTDATVAIDSGKVILTPRESQQLYCLDLLTGKPLWPAKHRSELVFHACIHNGVAVFVGNDRVAGINLEDGTPAWNENIMLESLPSGRGFYSEQYYYLPTTGAKLLKIDLSAGEVARSYETEHALGNLICFQEQVISLTPSKLETYYQAEPLRELVEAQLKENPDDPDALAQHAELLLQDGNQAEALKSLRRAYELAPENFRIARLLSQTILSGLRTDFAEYRDIAIELRPLIESPAQQVEYQRLMATGHRELGESVKAFEAYMKLAAPTSLVSSPDALEEVDRSHSVRRDRWLQAQLLALLNKADDKQRPALEALITEKLSTALATDSLASLREANDLFGFLPESEPVRLRMAELYQEAGRPLQAEVMLTHLQQASNPQIAMTAAYRLAVMLEQAEKLPEALKQYRHLAQQFPEQVIAQAQTAESLLAEFQQRHAEVPLLGTAGVWPNGRAEAALDNTRPVVQPRFERIFPIAVRQLVGPSPVGMQVAFDQSHTDLLVTSGWGHELQRASLLRSDGRSSSLSNYNVASYDALGHLLIASVGAELVAVDLMAPLREQDGDHSATLWRHDTSHSGQKSVRIQTKGLENPWGSARYVGIDSEGRRVGAVGPITRRGVCVQSSIEVICLDPMTGEPIWSRRDTEPGSQLFGDADHLFVVSPQGKTRVLNMLDGSELGTRQLPGESQRWHAVGRHVLCWERNLSAQANDRLAMYLLDALTGEKLWSKEFPLGTRATTVEHDELAFLTPQGKFELVTLADGSQRTAAQLELGDLLSSLYVMRSSQEYLVAVGLQRPRAGATNTSIQSQPPGLYSPLLDGKLWCLERDTAAMRWPAPADIDRFGLPLDQPGETPVLVMLRKVRTLTRTGTREEDCAMLLLDKRDGRQIFYHKDFGNTRQAYSYDLVGRPQEKRVTVTIPGFEVHVDYSQSPRPPQPPTQSELSVE
jgi:outer membrane protein assembly factor BamB/predicted Zn-dependent protease